MLNLSRCLRLAACTAVLLVVTACSLAPEKYVKPGVKQTTLARDYNRCLRRADADGVLTTKIDRRLAAIIDQCMKDNGYSIK